MKPHIPMRSGTVYPKFTHSALQASQKSSESFCFFFSLRNKILGAPFLVKWFFGNFNFKATSNGKIMPNFWRGGKARQINQGHLWSGRMTNFVSPLKNGVAEGVASDPHDTTPQQPLSSPSAQPASANPSAAPHQPLSSSLAAPLQPFSNPSPAS